MLTQSLFPSRQRFPVPVTAKRWPWLRPIAPRRELIGLVGCVELFTVDVRELRTEISAAAAALDLWFRYKSKNVFRGRVKILRRT